VKLELALGDGLFRAVEREFYAYSFNLHQLMNLQDRKKCLSVVASSALGERVDTGGAIYSPVALWFEQQEFLDEMIGRYRLRVTPIQHMLTYLTEQIPELVTLFNLRYRQKKQWCEIEAEMAISGRNCYRMRKKLVWLGAKFLGFLEG
jgi:hypothetical protein